MKRISALKEETTMHRHQIECFIRSLNHFGLTKQQIKTLRGQALTGDLIGAQKGLGRMVTKNAFN